MRIKRALLFVLPAILLLSTCTFTGCMMDMGAFETDEDYYASFGSVVLYKETGETLTFDLKEDFYNEQTVKDMKTSMDADYYAYFCIEIQKDMRIDELVMYAKSETSVQAEYSFFVLPILPSSVPSYDSAIPVLDENDPFNLAVATSKCALNKDMWDSFQTSAVGIDDGTGKKVVKEGDILCIRFDNNTCYGKEKDLKKYAFTLTDFMVRAI